MAFIERFSQVCKGDLIFIGNTLGLSKGENQNVAGSIGSIGAFTTLNQSEQVQTFPSGTTLSSALNESSAILNLPPDSKVLYAELVWSGVYKSKTKDISRELSKPIFLKTSKGKYDIGAEYRTKQDCKIDINNVSLGIYSRSANVTEYVQKAMSGTYSVGAVPTIIEPLDDETLKTNFAGWTLIVALKNDRLPVRTLNVKVGCEPIYNQSVLLELKGFDIPKRNINSSKILFSTGEGDAELVRDSVFFGKDTNSLIQLSGPNNDKDNFFASQINNEVGLLDTSGTFGDRNQDAVNHQNIVGGRQGWDITTINVRSLIKENYSKSVLQFNSTGDMYVPNAVGIAISNSGANLRVTKCADADHVSYGALVTYTIEIENVGDMTARDVVLFDSVPMYVTLLDGSIEVDGVSYGGKFPIVMSNLEPKQKHTVSFKVRIKQTSPKVCKNTARVTYNYVLSSGEKIKEDSNSNVVCLRPIGDDDKLNITKSVDKQISNYGEILTYTNTIKNISTGIVKDIYFFDNIPNATSFVDGSVFIDGVNMPNLDAVAGFLIGDLNPNDTTIITFQVKII